MNDSSRPQPDHRKLIPIWIKEQEALLAELEKPPALAVDAETQSRIEALLDEDAQIKKGGLRPSPSKQTIEKVDRLFGEAQEKIASKRARPKLPTQYEREQAIMKVQLKLPPEQVIVSPNAFEKREDIFAPRVKGTGRVDMDFINQEGNPDVYRVENWAIKASAEAWNGGYAYGASLYWRYRIRVPNFDTMVQPDRRLEVTPMTVLNGYYYLFSYREGISFDRPNASVKLFFWTGIWHWRLTGGGYEPEWKGWRKSRSVISNGLINGSIGQDVDVPYPGTEVQTPLYWPPPGQTVSPNPINHYGSVGPLDVVDFYVCPAIVAQTYDPISYAGISLWYLDVPFVRAAFEIGFFL